MEPAGLPLMLSIIGESLSHASGPVVWGEPVPNDRLAFFRLLQQRTSINPAEIQITPEAHEPDERDHPTY